MLYRKSILLLLSFVSLSVFADAATAQLKPVENVILITLDGLRWQELFGGAEKGLIDKEIGKVEDPKLTISRFFDDDPERRRELLMPYFWNSIAKRGQVFGDPSHQSRVTVENGKFFSYPGYSEILTGFADETIDSNDKVNNKNVTVLEYIHQMPEFRGRVAAFCSWDVFPFIINSKRSGIPVNAGWQTLEHFENDSEKETYRLLAKQLPRYWHGVRYDAFTFRGAVEYLKVRKPRVLYLALGETDDWAHAGRYDLYLESARTSDDLLRQLEELTQSIPQYRDNTAFVLTTDHGRGDGREGWKSHGSDLAGSDQIWIAVWGPNVPAKGIVQDVTASQGQVAATVAKLLGLDFTASNERVSEALKLE
ncbi:alkaline phosphatase family protein [Mariniblastus fucicola]|uniref:Type I phosphodiesterase / nucleotide pyrophosphatase n=1 Tax=Mariniblastus fucicola TaxID=980251 RepID=A0A5B9PFQ3_9BACT|nr:hypothetical protein [Mariniblastus fucicola]QEG24025.1 hypothetical protein MFFC18_39360 [Mariniblastus fucicola]